MKYYIVFALSICLFASCSSSEEKKPEPPKAIVKYDLATVEKGGVATIVKLPAQLAAFQEVSIFPKVNGYVQQVLVDIGSKVGKGTLLMTLEAPELFQAVLQAKEKFAKANADFSIDKERYQRLLEASRTAGAISPLDLSSVKAKMEADQALCNAEKANWQMQETMMGYLQVTAPFSGVITVRNVHPGALVSAADKSLPMLELKEIDHLRLQVDIPDQVSASLKSDNINSQYRSERIEIDVPNKDGLLSAGMFANVVLSSTGDPNAFIVPKPAVVTSTERKYVLVEKDGKAVKVDVRTGSESADKIEVYGNLQQGDKVVAKANDELKEGTTL
jgi:multidrug efflux pump subunit AcrA (membrane-fusion protein)